MAKTSVNPNLPPKKGEFSHKERQLRQRFLLWLRGPQGLLLGMILIAAAIYFLPRLVARQEPIPAPSIAPEPKQETRSDLNEILITDNVNDLYIASSRIQSNINNEDLPAQILALQAQMEIADRLDEIEAKNGNDPNDKAKLIRLRALIYWDRLNREHSLGDAEKVKDLRTYAVSVLEHENAQIAKEARLALVYSYCDDFAQTENPKSLEQFTTHADAAVNQYLNDQDSMFQLYEMVRIVTLAHTEVEAHHKELLRRFGDALVKSESPLVRQLGGQLHDLTIAGKTHYQDLVYKIAYGDEVAMARAKQIIKGAGASDKLSSAIFFHGIQLVEAFQRLGRNAEANALADQLENGLATQSEATRKIAGPLLEKFRRRSQLVGSKFELAANGTDGMAIDFTDFQGKPVVVFFMGLDDNSRETMTEIAQMKWLHGLGVRFVCVATKPDLRTKQSISPNPADFNRVANQIYSGLVNRFRFVQFVPLSGSQQLLDQCPVQTSPYIFILNDAHQVIARNANPTEIRLIVESSAWSKRNPNNH